MTKRLALLLIALFVLSLPIQGYSLPMIQETIYTDIHIQGHTYMYASYVDLYEDTPDGWHGGYWIGLDDGLDNQLSWAHTLPEGLKVPPDRIDRAKLWIDAEYVDASGNSVQIEAIWDWDPLRNDYYDNSHYVLTNIDQVGFWNGGALNVDIFAGEGMLRIDQAVLMMDYTSAPIPEPATALLVSLGLGGLALYRRRRR